MRRWLVVGLFATAGVQAACPPAGHTVASLQALKQGGFVVAGEASRHALAIGLQACLADPDPAGTYAD